MTALQEASDIPYTSLAAVRAAHLDLLREFRTAGGNKDDTVPPSLIGRTEQFVRDASRTGAVLDREADQREAQGILDAWVTRLYRSGKDPGEITLADFDHARAPELSDTACPYLGLNAFTHERADVFFGRQSLIDELIAKLSELQLLAIVGQSGSGKSSLVLAGILPRLMKGALPGSQSWRYFDRIVPGSEPLRNLARLFTAESRRSEDDIVQAMRRNASELKSLLERTGAPGRVLMIDQFEETFTLCKNVDEKRAYQANLANAAVPGNVILLTMRLDYLERLDQLPELRPIFRRGLQLPGGLTKAELTDAILMPAAKAGLKFDDGVVNAIVADVEKEPAALPLLQVMLLRMWEKRERNRITLATYKMVGGPRALENAAEEFFVRLLPEDQTLVKRILCRMVRPEGDLVAVARRVRVADLLQMAKSPVIVDRILQKLVAARLVRITTPESASDAEAELSHEALVRNWGRLGSWIDELRRGNEDLNRLELRAHEWERLGHGSGGLLDALSLKMFEPYLQPDDDSGISETAQRFLIASRIEVARRANREKQQKAILAMVAVVALVFAIGAFANWREALAAGRLAEAGETAAKDATSLAVARQEDAQKALDNEKEARKLLAAEQAETKVLLEQLALANGSLARLNGELEVKGRKFDASELTSHANAVPAADQDLALLLAIQAARITNDRDREILAATRGTLRSLIQERSSSFRFTTASRVAQIAFSPNGRHVAVAKDNGAVEVWNVFTRTREHEVPGPRAYTVSFRRDGVLGIGRTNGLQLWNVSSRSEVAAEAIPKASVTGIAFGDNGRLATASSDGKARIWNGKQAVELAIPPTSAPNAPPTSGVAAELGGVAWAANGQLVGAITGADALRSVRGDRWLHLWNVGGSEPRHLRFIQIPAASLNQERLRSIRFDEAGETIEVATEAGRRLYFATATGRTTGSPNAFATEYSRAPEAERGLTGGAPRRAATLAYGVAGLLAASAEDDARRTIRIEQRVGFGVMEINPDSGMFSEDGSYVLGVEGTSIEVRNVRTGELILEREQDGDEVVGAISRDGRAIAGAGEHVRVMRPGQPDVTLGGMAEYEAVALSADGTRVAAATRDAVFLWDVDKSTQIRRWPLRAVAIALSPRGDRLAFGNQDGSVSISNADGSGTMQLFGPGAKPPVRVVFDGPGRRVAAATPDGAVRVWDLQSAQAVLNTRGPNGIVDVRFSGDGRLLAVVSADDGAQVWNLTDSQFRRIADEWENDPVAVGFSGDSLDVLILDDYGSTAVEESDTGALIGSALLWLGRGWAPGDCERLKDVACPATSAIGNSVTAVAAADQLARQGNRAAAAAAYQQAKNMDPGLPVDPATRADSVIAARARGNDAVAAEVLRTEARARARSADFSGAEALYGNAAKLARNPFFDARSRSREDWMDQLQDDILRAIDAGRFPDAQAALKGALSMADGMREPVIELITEAIDGFFEKDEPEQALIVVNAASAAIRDWSPGGETWNSICWDGSLKGVGPAKLVTAACERAVKEENDTHTRDSRGVNRALLGDFAGAISDFEFFVKGTTNKSQVTQRQGWIEALKAGRNPLTEEELKRLRD